MWEGAAQLVTLKGTVCEITHYDDEVRTWSEEVIRQ